MVSIRARRHAPDGSAPYLVADLAQTACGRICTACVLKVEAQRPADLNPALADRRTG